MLTLGNPVAEKEKKKFLLLCTPTNYQNLQLRLVPFEYNFSMLMIK